MLLQCHIAVGIKKYAGLGIIILLVPTPSRCIWVFCLSYGVHTLLIVMVYSPVSALVFYEACSGETRFQVEEQNVSHWSSRKILHLKRWH